MLVLTGCTFLGLAGHQALVGEDPRGLASLGGSQGLGEPTWDGATTGPRLGPSRPTSVKIPRIDVRADIVELSMGADDVLDAPRTGSVAGWYRGSAAPGEPGSTVIAGHVDWTEGPAVFYDLGELRPEDTVVVTRADGRRATFTVHATRQYEKNDFPSHLVYGDVPGPRLRLITCGGSFSNGHYTDNIVVFAHLTDVDRPSR